MKIVEVRNLTKRYGKSRGIENVSFDIEKGEVFGFIGPNGAGKSTTIRTLLNYIYPTGGEARIFGMDVIKHTSKIKKNIGYLPSEVIFNENLKALDTLKYAQEFYRKDCTVRIKELAERLNLDLKKKVDDFSLGNRKKVGIIQAIMHSPDFLILDEPTSGLDPLIQKEFFNILLEERKRGATILFSSHVLSEVQKYCDRVAIIKEGKLLKVTTMEEISRSSCKRITTVSVDGKTQEFLFDKDINELVTSLSKLRLKDLTVEEPSLEEVFLRYYEN